MSQRGFSTVVVCAIAAACVLGVLSCNSPTALGGQLLAYVVADGVSPEPGKKIEIVRTPLVQSKFTDQNGYAVFNVSPGRYIVRAYDIGTPGPGRPYVEAVLDIQSNSVSRADFNDCTMCRSPSPSR